MACLTIGIAVAATVHFLSEPVFESSAKFKISLVSPEQVDGEFTAVRHDRILGQLLCVEKAIEANQLYRLKSLDGLDKSTALQTVVDGLEVTTSEPEIYDVRLRLSDPQDARTVLNNLLKSYSGYLLENSEQNQDQLATAVNLFESLQRESSENGVSVDFGDPKRGFVSADYSMTILQPATEAVSAGPLLQLLLMGAGIAAALWFMVWLLIQMLGYYSAIPILLAWLGFCGGIGMFFMATKLYESTATIQISQDFVPTESTPENLRVKFLENQKKRHQERLVDPKYVEAAFHQRNLFNLDLFEEVPSAEVVDYACFLTNVTQDVDEPTVYRLSFRSTSPEGCRTVLSGIVDSYRERLVTEATSARKKEAEEIKLKLEQAKNEGRAENELGQLRAESRLATETLDRSWEDGSFRNLSRIGVGQQVFPVWSNYLLYGTLAGYMIGLALASIVRSSFSSKPDENTHE
jgi:hypothetical protein